MEAQLASPTSDPVDSVEGPLPQIARLVLGLATFLISLLCATIAVRGVLGAFSPPISGSYLVFAALAAELFAIFYRIAWRRLHSSASRWDVVSWRHAVPAACVICVAIALSMSGANPWAVGAVWLMILAGELAWWLPGIRSISREWSSRETTETTRRGIEHQEEFVDEEEELGPNVLQQVTRSLNDEGVEIISGVLRGDFAAGERTHNLHVAFCPPLSYEPQIITYQLDGPPVMIKVAQAEVFGARIELRLTAATRPTEPATIYFEVQPS